MVGRDVEHLEVGEVVLDLRALVHDEAELGEDVGDLAHRLDARVQAAAPDRPAGQRDVERLGGEAPGQRGAAQLCPALGQGGLDRAPDDVGDRTDPRAIIGRQPADPAQDRGEPALLAQDVELERLERGDIRARVDRREDVVAERLEIARQVREVHVRPSCCGPGIGAPERRRRRGLVEG